MLQKEYKSFLSSVLSLLWKQWTAIGLAGHTEKEAASLVDPEALLLFSLSVCRYDARLFDEILDWLFLNGAFMNVQRLKAIQEIYGFSSGPQLSAVAEYLSQKKEHQLKWKKLAGLYSAKNPFPLFYTSQGKEIPVGTERDEIFYSKGIIRNKVKTRHLSRVFPSGKPPSFLFNLRALIGISARCELFCILAGAKEVHAAEAARLASYNRKTVQNALSEMALSGFIESRENGREKYYRLEKNISILGSTEWVFWAPLYKGMEILINGISSDSDDPLILSADFRRTAKEAIPYIDASKTGIHLTDPSRTKGSGYLDVFQKDLSRIVMEFDKIV